MLDKYVELLKMCENGSFLIMEAIVNIAKALIIRFCASRGDRSDEYMKALVALKNFPW